VKKAGPRMAIHPTRERYSLTCEDGGVGWQPQIWCCGAGSERLRAASLLKMGARRAQNPLRLFLSGSLALWANFWAVIGILSAGTEAEETFPLGCACSLPFRTPTSTPSSKQGRWEKKWGPSVDASHRALARLSSLKYLARIGATQRYLLCLSWARFLTCESASRGTTPSHREAPWPVMPCRQCIGSALLDFSSLARRLARDPGDRPASIRAWRWRTGSIARSKVWAITALLRIRMSGSPS
jgi:hypothetical protein